MTLDPSLKIKKRAQRTLNSSIAFSGIGIHTGEQVSLILHPAKEGSGIQFLRSDLPSAPRIPATIEYVRPSERCTTIGLGEATVCTIEHLLSALRAYEIDNVLVEMNAPEPPVGDGSALPFVQLIEKAGIVEQNADVPIFYIQKPIYYSNGNVHIVGLPSDQFKISYTLSYPKNPVLKAQYHSIVLTPESYKQEIAPCRTFSLYEEISYLMEQGLIRGGSLSNAIVIKGDAIFSHGGLRFPDEMVRHKVLDLIGDLSMVGFAFVGHLVAICSGHAAHYAFAKELFNYFMTLETENQP